MQNKLSAPGLWLVKVGIWLRERPEQFAMLSLEVQAKCGIQRMTGFVPQYAHSLSVGTTFYFEHLLSLEFHQAGVREIKRDSDAWNSVWREPFLCQPHVRLEADASIV
jgi:hypothetical protein